MNYIRKFDNWIEQFTRYLLITSVVSLLLFSSAAILFRWLHVSLLWIEPLIRHLVFLIAFLGGTIATGKKSHIGIDILGKYFENKGNKKAKRVIDSVISLISFITLVLLIYASIGFLKIEAQYGQEIFWGIASHYLVAIIPFGFSLMAIRFLVIFLDGIFSRDND